MVRRFFYPCLFALLFSLVFIFVLYAEGNNEEIQVRTGTHREEPAPAPFLPVPEERRIPELPEIRFPAQFPEPDPVQITLPPELPETETGPLFAVIPSRVRPGDPVTIAYTDDFSGPGARDFHVVLINSQGRSIARASLFSYTLTQSGQEVKTAVLAVPCGAGTGSYLLRIEAGSRTIMDLPLAVDKRDFIYEEIDLDQENTDLRTVPDPQKTAESETLWAVLSRSGTEIFDGRRFITPVASTRRTSFFGDSRLFRYIDNTTDSTVHAGIDFGVPTGTQVWSCAGGRVVMARFRIVTGNSVVLEHLPGLYSLYYHMDNIVVKEGDIILAGVLLGFSGSTGLATGPHLHWEIRAATEFADPDAFIARAVLDKDEILSNLRRY